MTEAVNEVSLGAEKEGVGAGGIICTGFVQSLDSTVRQEST